MLPQEINLVDFIYRSNQAATSEELKALFIGFIANFGMDRFIMGQLSHDSTAKKIQNMDIVANYPEEWLMRYKEQRYVDHDIVYQTALTTSRPFTWREISYQKKIPDKARRVFKEAQEFKLYNGMGLSIHQPRGEIIGMGLSSSDKEAHYDQNILHIIFAAANQFFISYSSLMQENTAYGSQVELTTREREIMLWLARGKRKSDIADILNITESAVKKHFENIFEKLEVNNLQLAVVKSLRMGLINPF